MNFRIMAARAQEQIIIGFGARWCLERSIHSTGQLIGKGTSCIVTKREHSLKEGLKCTPSRQYYEILGVSKKTGLDELKKAFGQRAKETHPDRNKNDPNAAKKFREVREAYEVLKDNLKNEMMRQMSCDQGDDWDDSRKHAQDEDCCGSRKRSHNNSKNDSKEHERKDSRKHTHDDDKKDSRQHTKDDSSKGSSKHKEEEEDEARKGSGHTQDNARNSSSGNRFYTKDAEYLKRKNMKMNKKKRKLPKKKKQNSKKKQGGTQNRKRITR